jgi:hypothetical protein
MWSYTYTPPNTHSWRGVQFKKEHRDNFTFTFTFTFSFIPILQTEWWIYQEIYINTSNYELYSFISAYDFHLDASGLEPGPLAGTCEHDNEPSGSINCGEFLE